MMPPPENFGVRPAIGIVRVPEIALIPRILRRIALAVGLILFVAIVLWFDRDGLRDNAHPGEPIEFVEVFYFTTVSLTTVGYGDIAPVTDTARLINAILLTPVRVFVWVLFLGTAYELTILRLQLREGYRMRQLRERLQGHVVVCGYGTKGRAIVDELLAHGHDREAIIVIDPSEKATDDATAEGLIALRGDASEEALLTAAVVQTAAYVMVAPNRDDTAVLLCLTVRSLAPDVYIVAAARQEENIKLLYRAGANLVVAPPVSGGRLMAAAVRQQAVAQFLQDLLTIEHGIGVAERVVRPEEEGLYARDLRDLEGRLMLGIVRGNERCPHYRIPAFRLEPGDAIVYLTGEDDCEPMPQTA